MNTHDPRGTGGHEGEDFTADWPAHQRPPGAPPPPYGAAQGHQPFPAAPQQQFQQPPGWYPAGASPQSITVTPKPEKKGRRRGLAIGAAFLAGIVVAGGAFAAYEFTVGKGDDTASGPRSTNAWPPPTSSKPSTPKPTTPSAAAQGNVDPAALRNFLLPAPEVDALLKTSGMVPTSVVSVMAVDGVAEPVRCMGVWAALHRSTYAVAPTTGVAAQSVAEEPKPFHRVIQGAVSFPDAAAAQAFVDLQTQQWGECQSRAIDITYGSDVEHVEIGPVVKDGDMLTVVTIPRLSPDAPKVTCERAMTARRNVVVDIRACAPSEERFGASVAREIAANLTK